MRSSGCRSRPSPARTTCTASRRSTACAWTSGCRARTPTRTARSPTTASSTPTTSRTCSTCGGRRACCVRAMSPCPRRSSSTPTSSTARWPSSSSRHRPYAAPGGTVYQPLGQIYYPMGVGWGTRRPATFVGVDAFANAYAAPDVRAGEFLAAHAADTRALQLRWTDGHIYADGPSEESYRLGKEEYALQQMALAWWAGSVKDGLRMRVDTTAYQGISLGRGDADPLAAQLASMKARALGVVAAAGPARAPRPASARPRPWARAASSMSGQGRPSAGSTGVMPCSCAGRVRLGAQVADGRGLGERAERVPEALGEVQRVARVGRRARPRPTGRRSASRRGCRRRRRGCARRSTARTWPARAERRRSGRRAPCRPSRRRCSSAAGRGGGRWPPRTRRP